MKMYVGVDLGGTNVRMAKADETGATLQTVKEPTEIGKGMGQVVNKIIPMIEHVEGYEAVAGIGTDVPGPVDTKSGKMILTTDLPGFKGYPIIPRIEKHLHVLALLDNDVNVAGVGEVLRGVGKGKGTVCCATISTGIDGALVVNQKVIAGRNGHAGEVTNLIIDRNREKVNYLNVGAIEGEAGDTAITRKGKVTFGEDAVQCTGDVFDLARKGSAKALGICDTVTCDLTVMFSQITYVVDPEVFVVGGGVMRGRDVFSSKMENHFRNMIHKGMQTVVFMEVELDEPRIIGAATLPVTYVRE